MIYYLDKIKIRSGQLLCILSIFISLYSLFFFLENKIYLIGSDTFEYMSIADSIVDKSEFRVLTVIPSRPVGSTQNGVVFIHSLFSIIGLSKSTNLLILVFLYYLLKLSSLYPLIKIADLCGIRSSFQIYSLISVYLGSWHLYRFSLLPNNDGMFNSLSVWLVYYIIHLFLTKNLTFNNNKIFDKYNIINIFLISLFMISLIHFRIQLILILFSTLFVMLVKKQIRHAIIIFFISLITIIPYIMLYNFVDSTSILADSVFNLNTWLSRIINNIKLLYLSEIPRLIFTNAGYYGNLLYIPFLISIITLFVCGFKNSSNQVIFYITSICVTTFLFSLLYERTRFMIFIFPYIYILIFCWKPGKNIGYLFVCVNLIASILYFRGGFWRGPGSKLWLHIYEEKISLPLNDPILLSRRTGHSYFFLNTRSYLLELTPELMEEKKSFFVVGDSTHINKSFSIVQKLATTNGYVLEKTSITPDLDEFEGWALVQLNMRKNQNKVLDIIKS